MKPLPNIYTLDSFLKLRKGLSNEQKTVVFTNGCFDLLHYGHISYLNEAKALGDYLVVGINSDASVSRLKGTHRPLQNELSRTTIMASLKMVDAVILFKEDTPENLIHAILPDVLVKGGDYTIDTIVGAKAVLQNGGAVKTLSFEEGYSTSAIENKIRQMDQ